MLSYQGFMGGRKSEIGNRPVCTPDFRLLTSDFRLLISDFHLKMLALFLCCWIVGGGEAVAQRKNGANPRALKQAEQKWAAKRKETLKNMEKVMGPLPDRSGLPVPVAIVKDSLSTPKFDRYTIHLQSFPGEIVPALLYIPRHRPAGTKTPAVLALHGTGDLGKHLLDSATARPNRAHATELAHRGYVVLAPDYPSFGDLKQHNFEKDRFQSGTMQAIFNHMRCLDYLQSRPDVDPDKLGVLGHSLGGHNAMFLGAFDERVKIVVASCGWTLFHYYNAGAEVTKKHGGPLGPWAQDRYMPLVKTQYGLDPDKMPFDFDDVIEAIAPRYFFSNSPVNDSNFNLEGIKKGIENVKAAYRELGVPQNLEVHYPEAGHDFPVEIREMAYRKLDSLLKK